MDGTGYDIKHLLFGTLFVLGNRLQTAGDVFYEEITCKQWFVMAGISLFTKEPPTINEIAETVGSSHQNIKQIVFKLEKAGFVKIYTDETDRRKTRVKLTEKCKKFEEKYNKKEIGFLDALYDGIDQEALIVTVETLRKMEQNLIRMKEQV